MNKFSLLIKTYMYERGIKQSDLAKRLNATQNSISKTLTGDNVTLDQMIRYSDALDCDLEIKLIPRKQ